MIDPFFSTLDPNKHVLIFDFDGTLQSLQFNSDLDQKLCNKKLKILESLSTKFDVAINTGRSIEQIQELLHHQEFFIQLYGNHGAIALDPKTKVKRYLFENPQLIMKQVKEFKSIVHPQLKKYEFLLEERLYSYSFHLHDGNEQTKNVVLKVMKKESKAYLDYEILEGKTHLEFRPKSLHKGQAIKDIKKINNKIPVYFGDDITDVDAFKEIKKVNGINVSVGPIIRDHADINLINVDHVWEIINHVS